MWVNIPVPWILWDLFIPYIQLSNEKYPGWLGYIKDYTTQLYDGNSINHEIRIPINQPVFQWKVGPGFFRHSTKQPSVNYLEVQDT